MERYPTKPINFDRSSILIVEDDADHWVIIYTALRHAMPQLKAVWVADEQSALEYLTACLSKPGDLPRLILLDLYLPHRKQGLRLLKQLKGPSSLFRLIPVLILSSSGSKQDIQETYYWACTSYSVKPTNGPQWLAYVDALKQYWEMTVTLPAISRY